MMGERMATSTQPIFFRVLSSVRARMAALIAATAVALMRYHHLLDLRAATTVLPLFRTVFPYKAGRELPIGIAHCRTCRGRHPAGDIGSARTPKAPAEGCPYKTAYPHCRR